jgi:predicted RNA binding protein YcfA (HicA-like mRNA interferase family)
MLKVRDMLKRLAEDGWYHARQEGSHRQFRHPVKTGTVTVAGHPSETLKRATRKSILRQAGLEDER